MVCAFVMKDGQVWIAQNGNVFRDVNNMDIATMVLAYAVKDGMEKIVTLVCLPSCLIVINAN